MSIINRDDRIGLTKVDEWDSLYNIDSLVANFIDYWSSEIERFN